MKIAYLVNQYPMVTHTFIRREIAALERHEVEVVRVSLRPAGEEVCDAADHGEAARTRVVLARGVPALLATALRVAVERPAAFAAATTLAMRIGWTSDRGVIRHLAYVIEACTLLRWCAAAYVTHVHAHFGTNPAAVALLCRVLGGPPYSFTVHGPEEFERAPHLALADKVASAAFVITVSEFGRRELSRWCAPEHATRIHVVRCGLDAMFLSQVPTPVPRAPKLVCVGQLCHRKGQLQLLDAVARLASANEACDLVLVGDGPARHQIESRIHALGLRERVTLVGWATGAEVRQHIVGARALILPSLAEGLPVVLMEALAVGRPVICTDVAGVAELVETGTCGWLVSPGSVDALVTAMHAALRTPTEELEQMGRNGAARVARLHNAELAAVTLIGLLRAADGNPRLRDPHERRQ
ncbi:MAG: glycosyltransferase family 4 protein [Deltaproteobacteria bacterium]|nr:glycosyltransferase family 4 protein [Deltaproteobacteria bacterium]MBI3386203.1 glycosyltransferase family 4 protein [Deltaproteobacteria bacterium]